MQDADAQHDQAAAANAMLKGKAAGSRLTKVNHGIRQAALASHRNTTSNRSPTTNIQAEQQGQETVQAQEVVQDSSMQEDKPSVLPASRKPAAAPASKRQKTAAKKAPTRKAKAAAASEEADSDDAVDGDEPDTAADAAADAATFSAQEVTEVNTSLLKWYDRVMRILPWRRNPHHKPNLQQQQQQQDAAAAASNVDSSKSGKQKKPSKAVLAAAEAAALVAAAKPAPADLTPQQFAYYVWVSEIMLQQTQVARVITYFDNWIAKWPSVQDLAQASQEQVNEVWAGLGYYRRARYLLEGAQYVMDKLDGTFPETAAGMRQIPGVGPYTAAAVASIAFNDHAAAVDGNVIRVISRLRALKGNPTKMVKTWDRLAAGLLHTERPGCHNQAMMELGATVCKPVNPLCEACPVSSCCAAYKQVSDYIAAGGSPDVEDAPRVTDYPEKVAKAAKHEQHVAVCVLKVLVPNSNKPAGAPTAAGGAGTAAGTAGADASDKKQKGGKGSAAAGAAKQGKINAFFRPAPKPAVAEDGDAGQQQQQQQQLCEQDVLRDGGEAHYLLVQRPATGLLAGLWEFPGVITEGELGHKDRRTAAYGYLSNTLGVQGLPPTAAAADKAGQSPAAAAAAAGGSSIKVLHQRQLGNAVHIFSHIRQTLHAEELVLYAPSLAAVCPAAAAATGGGAAAAAPAAATGSSKKRKGAGSDTAAAAAADGGISSDVRPCMRWVSAAEITQQGLTSGVRKVVQMCLK